MLQAFDVKALVDIRTVPGSRHNPQFGGERLSRCLEQAGIAYCHMKSLGGLRRPGPDSANTGWRNTSFRGYADYMQTSEFAGAVDDLVSMAAARQVAIMCAEALPWRCHRSLVGDALLVRDMAVVDIMTARSSTPHRITHFARVDGTRITYPPET